MKELTIKCNSKAEKLAAIAFLYALGYQWSCRPTLQDYVDNNTINFEDWPVVLLKQNYGSDGMRIDAVNEAWATAKPFEFSQLDQIPEWIKTNKAQTIKISRDYDATVSKSGGIEVDGQVISFEDFDKLAAIVANFR